MQYAIYEQMKQYAIYEQMNKYMNIANFDFFTLALLISLPIIAFFLKVSNKTIELIKKISAIILITFISITLLFNIIYCMILAVKFNMDFYELQEYSEEGVVQETKIAVKSFFLKVKNEEYILSSDLANVQKGDFIKFKYLKNSKYVFQMEKVNTQ